jgi:hypothetical protein
MRLVVEHLVVEHLVVEPLVVEPTLELTDTALMDWSSTTGALLLRATDFEAAAAAFG